MSRTTMFAFPEAGPCAVLREFPNSWGGAARVWSALAEKCFGNPAFWLTDDKNSLKAFWALVDDPRLDSDEGWTFVSTFDRALVERENFSRLAACYRSFVKMHPTRGEDSLPEMARVLDALAAGELPQVVAVGWQWTSVARNLWWVYPEERPYDLSRDTGHFFVFA